MQIKSQTQTDAHARFEELKAHEKLCNDRLDSLNRMLNRLSPSDHLYGAVVRGLGKWSREQIETENALWDALIELNCAAQQRPSAPQLRLVQ